MGRFSGAIFERSLGETDLGAVKENVGEQHKLVALVLAARLLIELALKKLKVFFGMPKSYFWDTSPELNSRMSGAHAL